jgi:hypothetical protein
MRRQDAVKVVRTVLTHWKNGDLTLAMPYWKVPEDSPPIYALLAYEMGEGKIRRHVSRARVRHARIPARTPIPIVEKVVILSDKNALRLENNGLCSFENDPSRGPLPAEFL